MIRQKQNPGVSKKRWGTQSTIALWSPSYFAPSCGGAPIAIIGQYIEQTANTRITNKQSTFGVRAIHPPP
jgi:REP element-mobilizing transposase RayT